MNTRETYFIRQLKIANMAFEKAQKAQSKMDKKLHANVGLESINRITDMSWRHDEVLELANSLRTIVRL